MDLGIEGRVALVMGATSGIGRGIATALNREGARVVIAARPSDRLDAAAAATGAELVLAGDTTDLDRMTELPGEVAERLAPVEILVTNTGGPPGGGALEHGTEEWERAYRSLVLAPRALISSALPAMREAGWGRVVNVGSSSTIEPIPGLALSNANRMASVGLFKTLSNELAGEGITFNTVATGLFDTDRLTELMGSSEQAEAAAEEQVPMGRLGDPAEYGDLVAFLCSDRAAYLTGAVIPLDGGRTGSV